MTTSTYPTRGMTKPQRLALLHAGRSMATGGAPVVYADPRTINGLAHRQIVEAEGDADSRTLTRRGVQRATRLFLDHVKVWQL